MINVKNFVSTLLSPKQRRTYHFKNDFVCIDVQSKLTQLRLLDLLKMEMPTFRWRGGDSDAQGPYVSGTDEQNISIQIWMGEKPMTVSISFSGYLLSSPDRETRMREFTDQFVQGICPKIGKIQASKPKSLPR